MGLNWVRLVPSVVRQPDPIPVLLLECFGYKEWGRGSECTFVTGRLEDTDAAQANKSDQVADSLGVVLWNGLVRLVSTYREGGTWGCTCSSSP